MRKEESERERKIVGIILNFALFHVFNSQLNTLSFIDRSFIGLFLTTSILHCFLYTSSPFSFFLSTLTLSVISLAASVSSHFPSYNSLLPFAINYDLFIILIRLFALFFSLSLSVASTNLVWHSSALLWVLFYLPPSFVYIFGTADK